LRFFWSIFRQQRLSRKIGQDLARRHAPAAGEALDGQQYIFVDIERGSHEVMLTHHASDVNFQVT